MLWYEQRILYFGSTKTVEQYYCMLKTLVTFRVLYGE